jgi:hypothetical protein
MISNFFVLSSRGDDPGEAVPRRQKGEKRTIPYHRSSSYRGGGGGWGGGGTSWGSWDDTHTKRPEKEQQLLLKQEGEPSLLDAPVMMMPDALTYHVTEWTHLGASSQET